MRPYPILTIGPVKRTSDGLLPLRTRPIFRSKTQATKILLLLNSSQRMSGRLLPERHQTRPNKLSRRPDSRGFYYFISRVDLLKQKCTPPSIRISASSSILSSRRRNLPPAIQRSGTSCSIASRFRRSEVMAVIRDPARAGSAGARHAKMKPGALETRGRYGHTSVKLAQSGAFNIPVNFVYGSEYCVPHQP